ncbi:MAG TPA: HI0074 family nucleotidyltransferase substrate-binding subunit [Candidatus Babeliales bacterium]|nr:HI0074 family nucleotidyltransferase substrate-binding subunit [Candidatus Babeliales bacterium]
MEELIRRHKQLLQAYGRLEYMVQTFIELSKDAKNHLSEGEENEFVTHRDALIKRFEICYDLTWKFFKFLLKEKYSIDVASPRKVFQDCYQQGILNREETENFLDMIDMRNQTTHVYDESVANAISKKIVNYYELLISTSEKIKVD